MYLKIVVFLLYMKVKIFWWYIMPLFRDFYYFLARYLVWSTVILGGGCRVGGLKIFRGGAIFEFSSAGGVVCPGFQGGVVGGGFGSFCVAGGVAAPPPPPRI